MWHSAQSKGSLRGQQAEAEDAGDAEELAQKIKELQRSNHKAKLQWIAFTDQQCGGIRDPTKHSAEILTAFLGQHNTGSLPDPDNHSSGGGFAGNSDDGTQIAETVKLLQRRSAIFKNVWASYCASNGRGRNDPHKHDQEYLEKFFEYLAQMTSAMTAAHTIAQPAAYFTAEPPMKRMRLDVGGGARGMDSGDPHKDHLVQQIKSFQRMGEQQKETWGRYVDQFLGGIRDPSRHDATTLQEFVRQYGVPSGGGQAGGGGGGRPYLPLTSQPGMDPLKDQLVARVKQFQKGSKEEWYAFCGATRDPARHDVARLQEFCSLYGC